MRKISIRWILILGMPGLVVGVIVFFILSTFFSSRTVFTEHAEEIMKNISSYTIDKARSHLLPARDAAVLTSRLAVNKIVTSKSVENMESYFYEQLSIHRQFSNIYYGTVNGEFIMASRKNANTFLTKLISYPGGDRQVEFIEKSIDFTETDRYFDSQDTYDPRNRLWYNSAVESGDVIWTDPYVFFTSKKPGITTASPVYDTSGNLMGVVGVDIEIEELSDFIASLTIGDNGKAFLLDENGQVIAYPEKEKITHMIGLQDSLSLVTIGELKDDITQAAYDTLLDQDFNLNFERELFFSFKHEHEKYHVMFTPFRASYWPWLMGIYIPEKDYIGDLKKNRDFTVFFTIMMGILTSLIGAWITRSIVSPLLKLQHAAEEVGAGRLDNPVSIKTRYRELDETAAVFESMRIGLVDYSTHMEYLVNERTSELAAKNRELGLEVEQRQNMENDLIAARNNAQNAQQIAESANKAKSYFLTNLSHEIRTPLYGIIGYVEMISQNRSVDESRMYADIVLRESERLMGLINRLLDISKIESRELVLEHIPFDVEETATSVMSNLKYLMDDKGLSSRLSIDKDVPRILVGDPLRLGQILMNLLSNSVKFTNQGDVGLGIVLDKLEGDYAVLRFSVIDTGIGIPEDKLDDVFKLFNQGDQSTFRRYGGTGLGIPIAKELTEMMEGTISVSSSLGKGTVFTVTIPFLLGGENDIDVFNDDTSDDVLLTGLKVMLAEDYPVNRDLVHIHLSDAGCETVITQNGLEAVEQFPDAKPDIILMDIQMPKIDGLEATRRIRETGDGRNVIIIGMTANAFSEDLVRYREAGMDDCLVKPFRKKDLLAILRKWSPIHNPNRIAEDSALSAEQIDNAAGDGSDLEDMNGNGSTEEVYDPALLMDAVGGDVALAITILEGFRNETESAIALFLDQDTPVMEIHRHAHSLKGGSRNVGAPRLSEAALALETAAKNGSSGDFPGLIEKIKGEYRRWRNAAASWEESLNL